MSGYEKSERRDFEFALFPVLRHDSGVKYLDHFVGEGLERPKWVNQTFQPRHTKFVVDLVGYCKNGTILHVEQETSQRPDMPTRMLEYGSHILIAHELKRPIYQILFYTGDAPLKLGVAVKEKAGLRYADHALGYTRFRYCVIDAGAVDTAAAAECELPGAALGLLVRDRARAEAVCKLLAAKILALPEERRVEAVVTCARIAALRGWAEVLRNSLPIRGGLRVHATPRTPDQHAEDVRTVYRQVAEEVISDNPSLDRGAFDDFLYSDLTSEQFLLVLKFASQATSNAELMEKVGFDIVGDEIVAHPKP